MGIKQHNGNTGIDRLAELKIRSASIQLATIGAIGLVPVLPLTMVTELQEIASIPLGASMA